MPYSREPVIQKWLMKATSVKEWKIWPTEAKLRSIYSLGENNPFWGNYAIAIYQLTGDKLASFNMPIIRMVITHWSISWADSVVHHCLMAHSAVSLPAA